MGISKTRNTKISIVVFALVIAVIFSQSAFAFNTSKYSADYDILGDVSLVTITVEFKQAASDFVWRLPLDAESIESNMSLRVRDRKDYKEISTNETLTEITFRYITSTHIEKSNDKYFILDFSHVNYERASIIVRLPENAKLKYSLESQKSSIIPKTTNVLSDGQRIIIRWTEVDFKASKALLVIYEDSESYSDYKYYIIGILLFLLALVILYLFNRPKNVSSKFVKEKTINDKDLLTRNLFEEEKLIIEELLKEKSREMWQKTLQIKTKLTKVKLSRKLRSLEAKGLIERISYGNAKKIRLKK